MEFHCKHCNHTTSGIILREIDPEKRWCPICRRQLIRCAKCLIHVSVTIIESITTCDACHQPTTEFI